MMRVGSAVVGLLVVVAMLLIPGPALAEDITVTSNQAINSFPATIKFQLEATSSAEITKARLSFRLVGDPASTYANPQFTPGTSVQVEHTINISKNYLPPGVDISYYWDLEDAAGHKLRTDPITFTVNDTRFEWRQVQEGAVTLLWYQGSEDFARTLLTTATNALASLSRDVGIEPKGAVKILIYGNQEDMLSALEPGAHEWTGGRSFSDQGIIVIAASPDPWGQAFAIRAVPHELSHVVTHQATDNPYGDIPHWLDEGLAMYAEGTLEGTYQGQLSAAIEANSLISLRSLASNFPTDSDAATLSYAESYSVVRFIMDRYGRDRLNKLLRIFSEGSTYDDALQEALGVNTTDLEQEWRVSLGLPKDLPGLSTPEPSGQRQSQPCGALPIGTIAVVGVTFVAFRHGGWRWK